MNARFRFATREDVARVHELVESAFRGESARAGWTHEADYLDGQRTDHDALHEIIGDPKQTMILAEDVGALVGCVVAVNKGARGDDRVGYFGMLTVKPTLQARGLGRQLVDTAEQHARDFGANVMEMTVVSRREELIAWYVRHGYSLTGRTEPFPLDDPRFGLPRTRDLEFVVMAKRL
jgi:predicted N-acetyltransferase YhbS